MIKHLLIFISILPLCFLSSCSKFEGGQSVPAYIQIDTISLKIPGAVALQGVTPSSLIKDAWVYVDDVLIGAFELPALFPVLHKGDCRITVRPGVLLNGMITTRDQYPFYENYEATFRLTEDSITILNNVSVYHKTVTSSGTGYYVKFGFNENFEGGNVFDTISGSQLSVIAHENTANIFSQNELTAQRVFYENWVGKISLDENNSSCSFINKDKYEDIPYLNYMADGYKAVFLEIDYKSDNTICIGTRSYSGDVYSDNDFMYLSPRDSWRRIYINLTNRIISDQASGADAFQIYLKATLDTGNTTAEILIDNIRLVHFTN